MMRVTVKLFGTLRRLSSEGTPGVWQGEIPEQSRISDLVILLGTKEAEVAAAMLNNEPCELDAEISDGSVVVLVTPFGGG
jgi:sulfur carrier protein ThiS